MSLIITPQASVIDIAGETQSHTFHASSNTDYIKFTVQGSTQYYIETLHLHGGADTELSLYDTDGSTLLAYDDNSGGGAASRITYTFPARGTYYLKVTERTGSANGGYDICVREVASTRYFPHIVSDAEWWTGIACVNTANSEAVLTMTGYDTPGNPSGNAPLFPGAHCPDLTVMGQTVSQCPFMPEQGKTVGLVSTYFEENGVVEDLAWAQVISDQNITGFELVGTRLLDRLAGISAPGSGSLTLYFPHVASDRDWSSQVTLVNITENTAALTIESFDDHGASLGTAVGLTTLLPQEKVSESVANFFGASANQVTYLKVSSDQEFTGFLLLSHNVNPQLAAEPAFPEEEASALYFPHVFEDPCWQVQIAVVNIGTRSALVSVVAYDDHGTPVGTGNFTLGARGKRFFPDPAEIFGGALPSATAYLMMSSDQRLIGYNLFATRDAMTLAGVKASAEGSQTLYFPHVASDVYWWTGLVFVNIGPSAASVTMTSYDRSGIPLGQAQNFSFLPAGGKKVGLATTFFSQDTLPFGTAWFKVDSSQPLVAFVLFGTRSLTQLAGFTVNLKLDT